MVVLTLSSSKNNFVLHWKIEKSQKIQFFKKFILDEFFIGWVLTIKNENFRCCGMFLNWNSPWYILRIHFDKINFYIWRWLFQQHAWEQNYSFFWPPEANMRFLTMILGRKGVQMTLSKFPISNFTGGQHAVNRRWPKSPKSWKNAISSKSIFCWKWLKQLLNWY